MCQNGGGGGAVTRNIVCFGGGFFEQLGAHVFEWVFEFNFFCYGNTIVGDGGCAEFAVKRHIASLGTQGGDHSFGNDVHAFFQFAAGFIGKNQVFSHKVLLLYLLGV